MCNEVSDAEIKFPEIWNPQTILILISFLYRILECLQIYNDKKGTNDVKGIENLPQEICLRYIIHLWKIVARVSEKHRMNERIMY